LENSEKQIKQATGMLVPAGLFGVNSKIIGNILDWKPILEVSAKNGDL